MAAPANALEHAQRLLAAARRPLSASELRDGAVALAEQIWIAAEGERSEEDRARAELLMRMMDDRRGQVFTTTLTDRAHRSSSPRTTISQASHLLAELGAPHYLGTMERLELSLLRLGGRLLPGLAQRKMLDRIHGETRPYIFSAAPDRLARALAERAALGVGVIVNYLGEEVLGEEEAIRRVEGYRELLAEQGVRIISVKASSICSQLDPLCFEASVAALAERLTPIYQAAGGEPSKLVVLDMEAYRDVEITVAAFRRVLDQPEFAQVAAGCALQAYLPESFALQGELLEWARARVARGKHPVRLRIVKGANLAAERVESELRGWKLPIYPSKLEVDANYKRMVLRGCQPENAAAANVGVASHNVFDLGLALLARASLGSEPYVGFELLEGMADPLRSVLCKLGVDVRVYMPVVEDDAFSSAIAYLVRRLDENTDPHNFLHHSFGMNVGDRAWDGQREAFERACDVADEVDTRPRRTVTLGAPAEARGESLAAPFHNQPDTDFTLRGNRERLREALDSEWAREHRVIASRGPGVAPSSELVDGFDPSRPGHAPYAIALASASDIEQILKNAAKAAGAWSARSVRERAERVVACADAFRRQRAELVAVMVSDAGKRADEADVEVSEAIDFAEYYARSALKLADELGPGFRIDARGVVAVTPPWNFPLAIPLGGVFASLVSGNAVILKPALETPHVAERAAELCWAAGVPADVFQLLVCRDEVGSRLIRDPRVASIVLTGATSTARLFQRLRPGLRLLAETGGKNAMIVMPMADREIAVQDIVHSAFGHAGQKCSALSLLVLHQELYDDAGFLQTLCDAARSLKVGSAWDLDTRVTPLIAEPNPVQQRALAQLDPGESWLLEPHIDPDNPRLVSPGIKLGVQPGSYSHQTEFFCPVLSVLRARDLDHAIAIANDTPYGLTSGLQSLDERDHARWLRGIQAGNLYINRRITGAIVRRQSFGGWKASSFGPGAKAGGPNYTLELCRVESEGPIEAIDHPLPGPVLRAVDEAIAELRDKSCVGSTPIVELERTVRLYQRDFEDHFQEPRDLSGVRGQDNYFRYLPARVAVYVAALESQWDEALADVVRTVAASWVSGSALAVLADRALAQGALGSALSCLAPVRFLEGEGEVAHALTTLRLQRIRVLGQVSDELLAAANEAHVYLTRERPQKSGRLELLFHLLEQSVSVTTHRYGHLGLHEVSAAH
jgi:RHH-type proline utilization regulon transcriptional repressor/proline dehydrogenase/delta 1-pyrroline-5-carboxylate dehydrogenase